VRSTVMVGALHLICHALPDWQTLEKRVWLEAVGGSYIHSPTTGLPASVRLSASVTQIVAGYLGV
jgi:hypothetical protein